MLQGKIHSIETLGLLDGPGIRTIFFLQGCPLRCSYCHNPDSQNMFSKKHMTPEEVVKMVKRYTPYYKRSGGGVTFSGGEPLLQGEFLLATMKLLKAENIHITLDTSGYGDERYYKEILKYVDLILLDVKHQDHEGYRSLVGKSMKGFNNFLSHLDEYNGKIWIRHVMVPGITDDKKITEKIFDNISHLYDKIEKIEILPYHTLGAQKYKTLGLDYPLEGVPQMDKEKAKEFENHLMFLLSSLKEDGASKKDII